jgi:hypothetical protein
MCVLAFLYAMGAARARVNGYWQEMIKQHPASYPAGTPKYMRGTEMRTKIECIMRDLGVVDDPVFRHDVALALHGPAPHPWQPHERLIARLREGRRD